MPAPALSFASSSARSAAHLARSRLSVIFALQRHERAAHVPGPLGGSEAPLRLRRAPRGRRARAAREEARGVGRGPRRGRGYSGDRLRLCRLLRLLPTLLRAPRRALAQNLALARGVLRLRVRLVALAVAEVRHRGGDAGAGTRGHAPTEMEATGGDEGPASLITSARRPGRVPLCCERRDSIRRNSLEIMQPKPPARFGFSACRLSETPIDSVVARCCFRRDLGPRPPHPPLRPPAHLPARRASPLDGRDGHPRGAPSRAPERGRVAALHAPERRKAAVRPPRIPRDRRGAAHRGGGPGARGRDRSRAAPLGGVVLGGGHARSARRGRAAGRRRERRERGGERDDGAPARRPAPASRRVASRRSFPHATREKIAPGRRRKNASLERTPPPPTRTPGSRNPG